MGTLERIEGVTRCLVLVLLIFSVVECKKGGGGSSSGSSRGSSGSSRSGGSRSGSSSSSGSQSSTSHLSSVHIPSRTSQSLSHSPSSSGTHTGLSEPRNYGFSLSGTHSDGSGLHESKLPSIGFKPSIIHGPEYATNTKSIGTANTGSGTHGSPSSYGFKASTPIGPEHATNAKTIGSANTDSGTHGGPLSYGLKSSAPIGPPTNVKPIRNTPPGAPYLLYTPPYTPYNPGYNPAHNPAGYGAPPAYNPTDYGHPPAPGYGHVLYPQQHGARNPAGYGAPSAYNPTGYGHPPASGYGHVIYLQQHGVHNPAGYGAPPAYNPAGYGHPPAPGYGQVLYLQQHEGVGYPSKQQYSAPGTNVNININANTDRGFGYPSYPSYHYTSRDTGHGTLGFFLRYSLGKVTTPTYHSDPSLNNGYISRYDHYEVHHYYHNGYKIPAQSTIEPDTITGCYGDSGTICPTGTTSLCTSNGVILCVTSATSTEPCTDTKQINCVKATIPCVNGTGDCEIGTNKTITLPCISSAKVPGNITYVNNTIIVNYTSIINNNFNGTTNATVPLVNLTDSALPTLNNITANGTITTTTTTEVPTTLPPNAITDGTRARRDTPAPPAEQVNEFCVTILAVPAARKPTEQENIFSKGTSIFSKFWVRVLGVN